ncbi:MAG: hypothetical protein HOP15_12120 [Planctomycetes bacterium]|nr:hypothetical protein [Planctomycetota bacterium]
MDSVQKRDRDRKQRQRRIEKAERKKDRAEQKIQRKNGDLPALGIDGAIYGMSDGSIQGAVNGSADQPVDALPASGPAPADA